MNLTKQAAGCVAIVVTALMLPATAAANAILVRNDLPDSRLLVEAFNRDDGARLVPCASLQIASASESHVQASAAPGCQIGWVLAFKFRTLDNPGDRYGISGAVCTLEDITWDSRVAVGPASARYQVYCYR